MQPLMTKFARLQRELDSARQQLAAQRRPKYSIASFIGSSAAAVEVKRQARRVAQTDSTGAAAGRDRHRQGTAGARHPCGQRARRQALRRRQHRGGAGIAARSRVLRRRARGLHRRRAQGPRRQVQGGRRRHAAARRDRRHAAGAAEQAAARAAGAGGRAAGQQPGAAHRRARHRRHQPRPAGDGGRGQLPRRPVLPAQRAADPPAAAARAPGRPGGAGRDAGRGHLAAQRAAAQEPERRRAGPAGAARLAGQHPRTAQRAGAGHADDRRPEPGRGALCRAVRRWAGASRGCPPAGAVAAVDI
jgi:hypothetical protein